MDVHCSTCGEPWDNFHLLHDAIYETGLSEGDAKRWSKLPQSEKLAPSYRTEFKAIGYEFGATLMNVLHCPACPKDAKPKPEVLYLKGEIEGMLGDDVDGIAAEYCDHGL